MKRKIETEGRSQMSAVSAIAARRARAQAQAKSAPDIDRSSPTQSDAAQEPFAHVAEEPPLKKAKSGSSTATRTSRSKRNGFTAVRAPQKDESSQASSSVESDAGEDTSIVVAEFNAADEPSDGLETPAQYDESAGSVRSTPLPERQDFLLSKTRLTKKDIVYATSDAVCIRLKLKATLAVIGHYDLWVKRGVISILGAKLHPSPRLYRVYAPSTHSLPVIKSVSTSGNCAEIELRSIGSAGAPYGLDKLSPLYERIRHSKDVPEGNALRGYGPYSFSILQSSSEDSFGRSLRPMHMDKKWSRAIQELSTRPAPLRVMACGPKGSGKSTFNIFLINHLLSPSPSADTPGANGDGVAFLDLDPGQPEFSPMGHVYLAHLQQPVLGPPYTHPTGQYHKHESIIKKSTFIGSSSPKDDPDYYVAATMDLLKHYHVLLQSYPRCPLVVNYPGWIFGLGLEIATLFIRSLGLTSLVYMSEKGPQEVIEPLSDAARQAGIETIILPSQPTDYVSRSSSQLRTMQLMSYFHASQDEEGHSIWSSKPLIQSRPMAVSYRGEEKGILGVMVTGADHDPDFLKELLEGSIVGIVAVDTSASQNEQQDDDAYQPSTYSINTNKDGIPYLPARDQTSGSGPDPTTSHSLGLALIHSIDLEKGHIILYTPIPSSTVATAIEQGHHVVLVKGQIDSPNWAISEAYFAARAAQAKHRRTMALAKGIAVDGGDDSGDEMDGIDHAKAASTGSRPSHHDLSVQSMVLRDLVRLAGRVPWMTVTDDVGANGADSDRGTEGRNQLFRLRKKAQAPSGIGDSDAEW